MLKETKNWNEARALISSLPGRFKSRVFYQTFRKTPYACTFWVLSVVHRLGGAMTFWKEGDRWMIGDFDTAAGTKGYAGYLVRPFFRTHVGDVVLSCWDENAESFWRYMAKKHGRTVRKIGYSLEGNVKLLLREA
jgi:hypothetical protein